MMCNSLLFIALSFNRRQQASRRARYQIFLRRGFVNLNEISRGCCTAKQHQNPAWLDDGSFRRSHRHVGLVDVLDASCRGQQDYSDNGTGGSVGMSLKQSFCCCMVLRFPRAILSSCSAANCHTYKASAKSCGTPWPLTHRYCARANPCSAESLYHLAVPGLAAHTFTLPAHGTTKVILRGCHSLLGCLSEPRDCLFVVVVGT